MQGILNKVKCHFHRNGGVRKVKITAKDIQENIVKIQTRINWVHDDIEKITSEMSNVDTATESGKNKYSELQTALKEKNELYSVLQTEMEQEYVTLKKFRESRYTVAPKDAIIIGGLLFFGTFMVALERENPKALKLATFLLKLFPLHL